MRSAPRASALLATSTTGLPRLRKRRASVSSAGVIPSLASTTNSATSASSMASSVCSRILPSSVSGAFSSRPAVSIIRNDRSMSFASPGRRSRVTPGVSSTSASFRPAKRLNKVDLPTLGRPTMAIEKLISVSFQALGSPLPKKHIN